MTSSATGASASTTSAARERFLTVYEKEHATTMRVLRALPADKAELRPSAMSKTARELAWVFALDCGLGRAVIVDDIFGKGAPMGKAPDAPARYEDVVDGVERAHREFVEQIRALPEDSLDRTVKFLVGPKQMGDYTRMEFLWFLLHDQIHHRGQFSIYLRMAGARVPSIYGPTADEPWM